MNRLRRDGIARLHRHYRHRFALHRYGIKNNLPFIFWIGYILDALIVAGVIGNFIVFLLAKTTRLNPLRTAITVFAVVHAALLLLIAVIASSIGPANWAGVLIGYRRVVAEEDSDRGGEENRADDRHHRNQCGPTQHRRNRQR